MVQEFGPLTLGLTAASLAVSAAGVWYSIRLAHRAGVMDVPNERSSHAVPTPRMGGVPMVGAAGLAFCCWGLIAAGDGFSAEGLTNTILFALAMSVLGFWDDLSSLSPLFRFVAQVAAALLFLWTTTGLPQTISLAGWAVPTALLLSAGILWIVWMLNLYNFMDGIDGLAGAEAAVASLFFFLVFTHFGESGWAAANLFVAAAALGFLVHNWPPARVFMGDAGSGFLGAFYGMQSVAASLTTPVPFLVLVLPFANFIMDTTATLIRRIWRGEKWYLAHRSHFYQRMTNLGMTHRRVAVLEILVVVASCVAAWVYLHLAEAGRVAIVVAVVAALSGAGVLVCRRESSPSN